MWRRARPGELEKRRQEREELLKSVSKKEASEEQQRQIAAAGQEILDRQGDVVNKFLQIAERKVSVLDDYGDERMHLLPKEIDECIGKLATREGSRAGLVILYSKRYQPVAGLRSSLNSNSVPTAYLPWTWIRSRLRELFIEYHELQKKKVRDINEINLLSGAEFESYIARMLQRCGWDVSGTPTTGDQGADLIASKGDRKIAFQVKRYTSNVGNAAVQEIVGAVRFYGAKEGCVVTNSSFTPSARSLAQKNNVRLLEGSNLDEIEAL